MIVYAVIDDRSISNPLGDAVETFIRLEDAERFIASVRRDDVQLASHLRIVERERIERHLALRRARTRV